MYYKNENRGVEISETTQLASSPSYKTSNIITLCLPYDNSINIELMHFTKNKINVLKVVSAVLAYK